jgi:hypothetical protein
MRLPSSAMRLADVIGEALRDALLGYAPTSTELGRSMDTAVDWSTLPVGVRAIAERIDGPMWQLVAAALLEGAERHRAIIIRDIEAEVLARQPAPQRP